ncbi:hypothetical protein, partial [Mycobacterium intracellulare]
TRRRRARTRRNARRRTVQFFSHATLGEAMGVLPASERQRAGTAGRGGAGRGGAGPWRRRPRRCRAAAVPPGNLSL